MSLTPALRQGRIGEVRELASESRVVNVDSVLNGRIGVEKRKPAAKVSRATGSKAKHVRHVECWGSRYVLLACVLSSGLNCWANVDLCGSTALGAQIAAGGLGAVVWHEHPSSALSNFAPHPFALDGMAIAEWAS